MEVSTDAGSIFNSEARLLIFPAHSIDHLES